MYAYVAEGRGYYTLLIAYFMSIDQPQYTVKGRAQWLSHNAYKLRMIDTR